MNSKIKLVAIAVLLILLVGMFATGFVLAQDSESEMEDAESDILATATNLEVDSDLEDLDILESNSSDDGFGVSVTVISRVFGWMVNSENTEAEAISGHWITRRVIDVTPEQIREIKQQYPDDPSKVREEILKLADGRVRDVAYGRLNLGVGRNSERYIVVQKEITNESVSLYLIPITERVSDLRNQSNLERLSVGTLDLRSIHYPDLTLRSGNLQLTSGNFDGTWNVNVASHANIATKIKKAVRVGFWQRFFRFGNNQSESEDSEDDLNESDAATLANVQEFRVERQRIIEETKDLREQARELQKRRLEAAKQIRERDRD